MRKIKYLTIALLPFTTALLANENKRDEDLTVSVGNLCEHISTFQKNTDGDKNFCDFKPVFSVGYVYPLTNKWALFPQVSVSLPKKSRDKNITKLTYSGIFNALYTPHKIPLSYFVGTGLYFTRLNGNGSRVVLNNGTELEEFQLPGRARVSSNWIFNFGVNYKFQKKISADLYSHLFNIESSEDRSVSLGFNINYHFGNIR